jgi:hypothetical protein
MSSSSYWSLSFWLPHQYLICISLLLLCVNTRQIQKLVCDPEKSLMFIFPEIR